MRRAMVGLVAIILEACFPSPSPSPFTTHVTGSPAPSTSAVAGLITESVGNLIVTHPAEWRVVPGPAQIKGGVVPMFYLTNAPISVGACPTPRADGTFDGCPEPIETLPVGGVLVTVTPNLGLPEIVPPQVGVEEAKGPCRSIGGERSVASVVAGSVLTACLRGPGLDQAEAQVRQLIATLRVAE